jgi:mRNA-degrading endonuclease YafQ of YafQ-DinJ toxin-antitoxin module
VEPEILVTKKFDKDMRRFSAVEIERIKKRVDRYIQHYSETGPSFSLHALERIKLRGGLEPTLYVMDVSRDIRLILTRDEDPLFDRLIVTLLRVVRHKDLQKAYDGLVESLYQEYLNTSSEGE